MDNSTGQAGNIMAYRRYFRGLLRAWRSPCYVDLRRFLASVPAVERRNLPGLRDCCPASGSQESRPGRAGDAVEAP